MIFKAAALIRRPPSQFTSTFNVNQIADAVAYGLNSFEREIAQLMVSHKICLKVTAKSKWTE